MSVAAGTRRSGRVRAAALLSAAIACASVLAAGGCGGSDAPDGPGDEAGGGEPADEQIVRRWSAAVNSGDYEEAADLFADGAVVEQGAEITLDTHADAVSFNRSLPCRADVTDVDESHDGTLAAFDLRRGPTGECQGGGSARVLFVIGDGEIEEWRQLPAPAAPEGDTA